MKLLDYVGHTVRVKLKGGSTYVGFVEKHNDSKNSLTGREEFIIGTHIAVVPLDEIEEIDFAENRQINRISLLSAEEIAKELNEPVETIIEEVSKIDHTEYGIDANCVMYDLNTSFKVAANLGKMNMFEWFCDNCDDYLNEQEGFENNDGKWKCTKCGHVNIISKEKLEGII